MNKNRRDTMIKKKFAFLAICLFFLAIITSACGSGGKTTPPDNSAFYYLLAQQNTNNNEQERQNESIPDPSPTSDLNQTPNPEPTTEPTQTPTLEVSKSELSLIVGGSEDITVSLDGNPVTDGL